MSAVTATQTLRILIADDHEIVRRGVRAILEERPGWRVVGEVSNGRAAVEETARLKPAVVVLDIGMPELNGLEATRQILDAAPQTQVVVLTLHDSEELVRQVLAAGARGYVLKMDSSRDLVAAVEALSHRRTFFTQKISDIMLASYLQPAGIQVVDDVPAERLSKREREVLQMVAEGKGNKEIAWALKISVKTVETHRSNLMAKLNLHSMQEVMRYAIRNRIVD